MPGWRCAGFFRGVLAGGLVAALSGCYVPVNFFTDVEITRSGHYRIAFDGYLVWAPLHDQLRRGALTPAEERDSVARIVTDLKRDGSLREARYMQRGRFKVNWQRSGDLTRTRMVSFPRQSDKIVTLRFVKTTGDVILEGTSVSSARARQLVEAGLDIAGEVRVRTDARVVSHNATAVTDKGVHGRVYAWKIRSAFDPPPRLVIAAR
ncbi:MAG: hypothetical protein ACFCUO_09340 [Rhodospirillales bacterium]